MKRTNITYGFLCMNAVLSFTLDGCIEEFDVEFEDFESALVVEATITNEEEQQQVFLSRTYKFEEEGPTAETNARVSIIEAGNTYILQEIEPGIYISEQAFAAQPNTAYKLLIETQNGRTYSSNEMTLTDTAQIDNLSAERITNDFGEDGVAILVDSFDASGNSKNFRYEFSEPCLEIAPKLISQGGARCILSALVDANQVSYSNVNDDPPFEEGPFLVVPRECGDCTILGSNEQPGFWIE